MTSLVFYLSSTDSQATTDQLTLPTYTPEVPDYDYAVDLSVPKTDLNLFTYTLNNENWDTQDPDKQDVTITFDNYASSALSNLKNVGDFALDTTTVYGADITEIMTNFNNLDGYKLAILYIFKQHYGNAKVLSLFSGENTAVENLANYINTAIGDKVSANATALPASSEFITGDDTTVNNAVNLLKNIIQVDAARLNAFDNSTSVGLSDLLNQDDILEFVVTILENLDQANLDGTQQSEQKTAKMLVRLHVTA